MGGAEKGQDRGEAFKVEYCLPWGSSWDKHCLPLPIRNLQHKLIRTAKSFSEEKNWSQRLHIPERLPPPSLTI